MINEVKKVLQHPMEFATLGLVFFLRGR